MYKGGEMRRIIVFTIIVFCAAAVNAFAESSMVVKSASERIKNQEVKADESRSGVISRVKKSSASKIKKAKEISSALAAEQSSRSRKKTIKARAGTTISSTVSKTIKVPEISTTSRIKAGSTPKFRQTSLQSRISSSGGTNERSIQSTDSAMSNMRVRYMNKVMNGKIDFAVSQGGK